MHYTELSWECLLNSNFIQTGAELEFKCKEVELKWLEIPRNSCNCKFSLEKPSWNVSLKSFKSLDVSEFKVRMDGWLDR